MARKTGNGTKAKQELYVMVWLPAAIFTIVAAIYLATIKHPAFVWLAIACPVKIGIGGNSERRRREIDNSLPGPVWKVFSATIRNAYGVEQSLHRALRWLNVPMMGSGKTEWFFGFAFFPAVLMAGLVWATDRIIFIALMLAFLWAVAYIVGR